MHKILIADDTPQKITDVLDVLSIYDNFQFTESYSFDETVDLLINSNFDLIVLDMSLPTFNGEKSGSGRMRALGGKDILDVMDYEEIITPVIVFTQFDVFGRNSQLVTLEDINTTLDNDYSNIYLGSVMYDSRYSNWKQEFIKLIPKELTSGI
ncbi:response regulator transcription factor [Leucothrix arctica]|uniref:Response regulatory domain-containing protein n=1 Tax=Leucothrix arctica TaxID=1481894 RepID=A0A317C4X6_9GAMM|nr:response regulator transcription factor [Leucothrix arctica]PWQ93736.1 hypothetical protein DKT75_19190 [Leucothrix arctica]